MPPGYGGTLGEDVLAGSRGFWKGQCFWKAADRAYSINLRELRGVRLLLQRHFAAYVFLPDFRRLLLHEDNQAVCFILKALVSAPKPMMAELRRLQVMLQTLGSRARHAGCPRPPIGLPTPCIRPGIRATRRQLPAATALQRTICCSRYSKSIAWTRCYSPRPLGDTPIAGRKFLASQMEEDLGTAERDYGTHRSTFTRSSFARL